MKHRVAGWMGASLVAIMLGGCLGHAAPAPTDRDVVQAVRTLVWADLAPASAGPTQAAAPHDRPGVAVRNLGCNPAPDYKGYLCETDVDVRPSGGPPTRHVRLVRMVKAATGWRATMQ